MPVVELRSLVILSKTGLPKGRFGCFAWEACLRHCLKIANHRQILIKQGSSDVYQRSNARYFG